MSAQRTLMLSPNNSLNNVIQFAGQNLSAQGYQVQSQMLNDNTATLFVTKSREGFSNIIGLGLECRVTLTIFNGGQPPYNG